MRNKYVIGNWKLNGSLQANESLVSALKASIQAKPGATCAVCAPMPYLAQLKQLLGGSAIAWGAQDASRYDKGAYTGEVAAAMIAEFGARFCLIGHSERRALFGETDRIVCEKLARVKAAGLTAVVCVGETLEEREAGKTEQVVGKQVGAAIAAQGIEGLDGILIAYEPVWAIGTGKTASPAQAQEVHAFIRATLAAKDADIAGRMPILYGGSVKAANAPELFNMPDIDGGLIGGASLQAEDFAGIWRAL